MTNCTGPNCQGHPHSPECREHHAKCVQSAVRSEGMYRPSAEALHEAFYETAARLILTTPPAVVRACMLEIEDRAKTIDAERALLTEPPGGDDEHR